MRKRVASGITAACMAVATTVVGMMWPTIDRKLGIILLIGCGVGFVVAGILWFWPDKATPVTQGGLTTHGPQSHNIGQARDVYINHPTPAATQPVKSPYGSGQPPKHHYPLEGRRQEYPLGPHHGPKPNMELRDVVERVTDSWEGPSELANDFEVRVERKIKDGVQHWHLHTWGRRNNPDAGLDGVWGDAWLRGKLNWKKGWLRFRHPDNPNTIVSWTDLHFNRDEVDAWLPPKEGRSPTTGY